MGSKQQARGYAVNVVDSCGWLEHLIGGSNSYFFEPILADQDRLLIPQLVIYEVCRRVLQVGAPGAADKTAPEGRLYFQRTNTQAVAPLAFERDKEWVAVEKKIFNREF